VLAAGLLAACGGKISLVADVASRFQQLRDRYGWLDHLVRAGAHYTERHGNDYGAAVTYFSVLSLVPVTMVAFAAAGFALGARPQAVERLKNEITAAWPGALGDTLNSVINQAISSAATVGFFGLLAAL
jgi:membrane protein